MRNWLLALVLLSLVSGLVSTASAQSKMRPYQKRSGSSKAKSTGVNVSAAFKKGKTLFEARKYAEATLVFNKILKKFPKHQPSIILYARSLYKLEKIKDAYYLFSRANPALLDPDAAYEYGQTFYQKKQYGPGLVAFKRVPSNHPFGDLAKYYGGICALKLRRYDEAESMIAKAVVLPEREAKTRSLYLKHIERLKQLQQRKALAQDRARERARLRNDLAKLRGKKPPTKTATQAATPPEPTFDGFKVFNKHALIGVKVAHQRSTFFEESTTSVSKNRETYFDFESGPYFQFAKKRNQYLAAGAIQIKFKGYEEFIEGTKFIDHRKDSDEQLLETSFERNRSVNQIGTGSLNPWIEFSPYKSIWLSFEGEYTLFAPKFVRKDRTASQSGRIGIGYKQEKTSALAKAKLTQAHNPDNLPLQLDTNLGIDFSQQFWDDGGIYLDYDYFDHRYLEPNIDGADHEHVFEVGINQTLLLGFSADFGIGSKLILNYTAHNLEKYPEARADGSSFFGTATLAFNPAAWLSLEISGEIESVKWDVFNKDAEEVFRKKVADTSTTSSVDFAVNLIF